MTEYHFDDKVYTDYTEFKKALAKDWYKKYNPYMIKEFFYIGRKFVFGRFEHEVLDNNAEVSETKGWLYLKSLGERPYEYKIYPRKVLKEEPSLREELDQTLKDIDLNETELYEQMELF
ncbi:hypothetical protein [Bacillus pseudomycoides]|uniref:hypothetical protein n=1 Tax=Bacillus pseudomycoides TaxID=64104 RepID=UPI000BF107EF|nr:hypothetical protein [Bacillus pseudomycoides]PEI44600.1 hypothetical protein CN641_15830 [Bacillus pseudomycoides]PFY13904.1 hypothetical protein COL42_20560 [Bacillus pseudomycoides]